MRRFPAFALVELLVSVATVAVLICLLLAAAPQDRSLGWQAGSIANLHEFATGTGSYAADNTDQFWSYSWRAGVPTPSQYPDLHVAPFDAIEAAAAQAADILRRRSPDTSFPYPDSWVASIVLFHLPLVDYLQTRLPARFAVSPGDRYRGLWANDIAGFDANAYLPNQPDANYDGNHRLPYTSSYRVGQAFFSPDAVTATTGTIVPDLLDGFGSYQLSGPTFNMGGRRTSEVAFPSQKVHVFDVAQWQGAKQPVFFAYPFARIPMLLVDGSARVRLTGQSNQGFRPQTPRIVLPTHLAYSPYSWDAPLLDGYSNAFTMHYYWTRGGLRGRDFDGDETDTSNW